MSVLNKEKESANSDMEEKKKKKRSLINLKLKRVKKMPNVATLVFFLISVLTYSVGIYMLFFFFGGLF